MIIAAHQPNYLPWLGYFDRVRRCDKFLLLDHVQFERQNFQNRTRVRVGDEARWLTVPVVQKSRDEVIKDKEISNDREGRLHWGRKQYATLEQTYRSAPHFKLHAPWLREIFEAPWTKLIDLNVALLRYCLEALEIRTPLVRTSEMGEIPGQKSELVLNMCKMAGATAYLSGEGASRDYLDQQAFAAGGVSIIWQGFKHPEYPQGGRPFLKGLSVLDLLFHCGPLSSLVLAGAEAGRDAAMVPQLLPPGVPRVPLAPRIPAAPPAAQPRQ